MVEIWKYRCHGRSFLLVPNLQFLPKIYSILQKIIIKAHIILANSSILKILYLFLKHFSKHLKSEDLCLTGNMLRTFFLLGRQDMFLVLLELK